MPAPTAAVPTLPPQAASIPRFSFRRFRRLLEAVWRDPSQFRRRIVKRTCPICGYHGIFISVGHPPQWDVRCLECGARHRHRLTHLWVTEGGGNRLAGRRILHFAPEKAVVRQMRSNPLYETADLHQPGVTHSIDITRIPFPDATYDVVIAHHVLEHIDDDRAAVREIHRILRPGGFAILTTPINGTRETTYENPAITDPVLRTLHFSAPDHRRYYGLDFETRLQDAGFTTERFRLPPDQEVKYGLLRDEWITIAYKS
ncbi:MAG: class I SAM-dependent methyltransferase [Acetobacteraceae bacterium]|nr:class I SAM-dependent methyltransferase [Acetobacteraceae bacterium]